MLRLGKIKVAKKSYSAKNPTETWDVNVDNIGILNGLLMLIM